MGIKVRGANRVVTSELIVDKAIGMLDPYGEPFELITLKYTARKKTYHKAKCKGFEDVIITRNTQTRKLSIEYRHGSVEWLKDPIGGEFIGRCARTKQNMEVLAAGYYNKMWTIAEAHIRELVKKRADEIDNESKKHPCPFPGGYKSLYEHNVAVIEGNFKGKRGFDISQRGADKVEADQMTLAEADLEKRKIKLAKAEAELKERQELLKTEQATAPITPVPEPIAPKSKGGGFSFEELNKMNPSTLKKKARDEYGITNSFQLKKPKVIELILEQQAGPVVEEEPEETKTEVVTG